jgi:hypothetical protein
VHILTLALFESVTRFTGFGANAPTVKYDLVLLNRVLRFKYLEVLRPYSGGDSLPRGDSLKQSI